MEISGNWSRKSQDSRSKRKIKNEKKKQRRSRKKIKKEEKTKRKKNGRNKESSRRIGDLGWGGRSSKIWRRGQEIGFSKILQVDSCLWKESE